MPKRTLIGYQVIPRTSPNDKQEFEAVEEETRRITRRITIEELDQELEALEARKQEILLEKLVLAQKLKEVLELLK